MKKYFIIMTLLTEGAVDIVLTSLARKEQYSINFRGTVKTDLSVAVCFYVEGKKETPDEVWQDVRAILREHKLTLLSYVVQGFDPVFTQWGGAFSPEWPEGDPKSEVSPLGRMDEALKDDDP